MWLGRNPEMHHRAGAPSGKHDAIREGFRLGCVAATSIWIWIATVDAIAGEPFRTFNVLGGSTLFTAMLYVLNIAYGMVIVSTIHGLMREPSLIGGLVMGFLIIEFAFAMASVVLSHFGLGQLAWLRIFGGSIIGAVVAVVLLMRGHPLAIALRQARMEERAS